MDYQGKILKEYSMLLNMLSQQTLLKCKQKFLSYLCKSAAKMNQWKSSIANIIAWHILTNNILVNNKEVQLMILFTRYMIKTRSLNSTTIL